MAKLSSNKPTIGDVAKLAGVVPSTVSHVLNGTATISLDTKSKVMEAVEQLNYSPNAMARALRQKKTKVLGVVLRDISSEFYARCTASIFEEARKDGYVVLICDSAFDEERMKDGVNALIERRVDGLIFVGGGNDEEILAKAKAAHIPFILADRNVPGEVSVEYDNFETVRKAVHALWENGYREYLYFGEREDIQKNLRDRYYGFLKGMEECKLTPNNYRAVIGDEIVETDKYSGSYRYFKERVHIQQPGKAVVLTSNDMIAMGVISAAISSQIRVPGELAVIGFDDINVSKYYNPSLTTIRQNEKLLGQRCYEALKALIYGEPMINQGYLQQDLVIRESAVFPKHICEKYHFVDERGVYK